MRRLIIAALICIVVIPAQPAQPAAAQASPCARAAVQAMLRQGAAYEWGAKGPSSFDCSGLTYWAYLQANINIGGSTYEQQFSGVAIPCRLGDLDGNNTTCWAPGDLIFLRYPGGQHVAIYVGDGVFADAYSPSTGVILHAVEEDIFYRQYYWQSRRIVSGCEDENINPAFPSTPPSGPTGPAAEQIADVLQPIALRLPITCAGVPGVFEIPTLAYPTIETFNPLTPFQWFGVFLWNEIVKPLICFFIVIVQFILDVIAGAINATAIAFANAVWRSAWWLALVAWDAFLAAWGAMEWARAVLWDISFQIGQMAQSAVDSVGDWLNGLIALISLLLGAVGQAIGGMLQALLYVVGLFFSIIPGVVSGLLAPTAPPQLSEAQSNFLWVWFVDIFRAIADSQLGWAWAAFVALVYLRFAFWLVDEMGTLNQ